jgi:hypothetical protein
MMKTRLLLAVLALSTIALGQSTQKLPIVSLSAACTNATTTCDGTANSQFKTGTGDYSIMSITAKGTFTGATINFEFSDDGGTTWFPTSCTRNDAAVQENSETLADSTNRSWDCGTAAAGMFRVRLNAISTGAITLGATLSPTQVEPAPTVSISLPSGAFAITSNPAAGSQATASQAAAGALIKNVATAVCFSAGSTTAPALTALTVNLRDGATGAGTIKWTMEVIIPASTGQNVAPFCAPVNVIGSANTAMTLEFSASLANLIESVSLQGYTTNF